VEGQDLDLPGPHGASQPGQLSDLDAICPAVEALQGGAGRRRADRCSVDSAQQFLALPGRGHLPIRIPSARHQLAIVVMTPTTLSSGRGWAINRSTNDFNAVDVALARSLQPMLALLDRVYAQGPTPKAEDGQRDEARRRAGLTFREVDMITLVAEASAPSRSPDCVGSVFALCANTLSTCTRSSVATTDY
jgi:hypothetical protein